MNQSQTPIDFSEQLIKGKIVETVFYRMFNHSNNFVVLPFGYENILPAIAGMKSESEDNEALDAIKRAPDFVVIDKDEPHDVKLVEVKYLKHPSIEAVLKKSKIILQSWKPAYLFLATPKGFYFNKVSDIVKNEGKMDLLSVEYIPMELQAEYVNLVNRYIEPI